MKSLRQLRQERQRARGRVVYIIEVDGLPEGERRHAYRTEGIARAAAIAQGLSGFQITKYVPCS